MKLLRNETSGFTIIELLIATSVFSIILLITASTLVGISQTYIKGSVQDQTQQTARSVLTDLSQDIQFNSVSGVNGIPITTVYGNEYFFCIGNDVYIYHLDMDIGLSLIHISEPTRQAE